MESAVFTFVADVRAERTGRRQCGRFSTGIEQLPETPSTVRVGSFGDGSEQIPLR